MELTPYLFFQGNCFEAMSFYGKTLCGEVWGVMRNGDAPNPESRMPGGDDLILNMALTIGDYSIMASDNSEQMYEKPQGFRLSFAVNSRADFDRIYETLSQDALAVEMAPEETFWAARFAMFTDRYGTPWMLSYSAQKE